MTDPKPVVLMASIPADELARLRQDAGRMKMQCCDCGLTNKLEANAKNIRSALEGLLNHERAR